MRCNCQENGTWCEHILVNFEVNYKFHWNSLSPIMDFTFIQCQGGWFREKFGSSPDCKKACLPILGSVHRVLFYWNVHLSHLVKVNLSETCLWPILSINHHHMSSEFLILLNLTFSRLKQLLSSISFQLTSFNLKFSDLTDHPIHEKVIKKTSWMA